MQRAMRWLGVIATIGMFVVLLQGTLVTNTNSAYGCGNTWPLCHGKLIPELRGLGSMATAIEFSHRAVVPIESTLILSLAAGGLWFWRRRREIQILAPSLVFFLFLQALLGGLAVMFPESAPVLALHFGISLMAFASVLVTTAFILEVDSSVVPSTAERTGRPRRLWHPALAESAALPPEALRDRPLPDLLRWSIWGTLLYIYCVVYLGAFVRHVGASLSCLDWPLCNGAVVPRFVTGVGPQYAHRVAAFLGSLLIAWLFLQTRRLRGTRPDLYYGSMAAVILVVLQILSGGIVVVTRLALASTLLHSALISLLFGALSYLCLHTLPRPANVQITMPARDRTVPVAATRSASA